MPDTLTTLRRLRQLAANHARRELAAALGTEHDAERRQTQAQTALQREAAADPLDAAHPLAGAYASWRPAGIAAMQRAAAAASAAAATVMTARATLAAARAAERAVEKLQEDRAAQCKLEALRKSQR